jgi:hypothetical protein
MSRALDTSSVPRVVRELQTSWEKGSTNTLLRWENGVYEYTTTLGRGVYDYRLEWGGGVYDYRLEVGRKVLWIGGCALVRVLKMDELCTSSRARITD